ncbi:UNVERIFIED_CONTAM: Retrovirus-related Pol polyprotein from transposon TNT 1-94 [Sesamum indicum]
MAGYSLQPFDGKRDFAIWQQKTKGILIQQKVFKAIDGNYAETVSEEKKQENDKFTYSSIILNLSDTVLRKVGKQESSKALWYKLEEIYTETSLPNKLFLLENFFRYKLDLSKNIDENLDNFTKLIQDIKLTGDKNIDEYSPIVLLNAIPEFYSDVKVAIKYGRDSVNIETVVNGLESKELDIKTNKPSQNQHEVNFARGRMKTRNFNSRYNSRSRSRNKNSRSKSRTRENNFKNDRIKDRRCYNCGIKGHYIKDCRKPRREHKDKNYDQKETVNNVSIESNGEVFVVYDANSVNSFDMHEWLIDSGCTFHMGPFKDIFSNLKYEHIGFVSMANEKKCDIKGLGDISLCFEGGHKIVLKNIRYVPDLSHNLISCAALEEDGLEGRLGKDYVHAYVWGPSNVTTHGGNRYFLSIIDNYSRKVFVFLMKYKSEVFDKFEKWKIFVENQTSKKLKSLRTDNGLEFWVKGYRLWVRSQPGFNVLISRDVTFNENEMPCLEKIQPIEKETTFNKVEIEDNQEGEGLEYNAEQNAKNLENLGNTNPVTNPLDNYQLARDRNRRQTRIPSKHRDFQTSLNTELREPSSVEEVLKSEKWLNAVKEEMKSLKDNKTWILVHKPKDASIVDCKWLFKIKQENPIKYMARLVAKGFTQKEGIDYNEIFSLVVKYTTVRIILALTAHYDWELKQMDVKTAFLHDDLDENIYMTQPFGFSDISKPDYVCLLKKSLYGLKQSPRQWNKKFDEFMLSLNFTRSNYDHCLYFKYVDNTPIFLVLYVDDMLIASPSLQLIHTLQKDLCKAFEMKDLDLALVGNPSFNILLLYLLLKLNTLPLLKHLKKHYGLVVF